MATAARHDEQELIAALQSSDRAVVAAACAELVQTYSPRIYRMALKLMGTPEEAEEVLQETFISACQHIGQFAGRSALGTWLYRIGTNVGLMRLRRRRPEAISIDAPMETDDREILPQQLVEWRWQPEEIVLSQELRQALDQAVAELPETLRAAFILRDIEGLSTAETAEALGISVAAAKVRLHRARLQLRESLSRYFAAAEGIHGRA